MKRCTKCKNEYPATLEYFYKDKNGRNGLHSRCKNCHRDAMLEYRKTEAGKQTVQRAKGKYNLTPRAKRTKKNYELKRRFNITLEQYDEMFEKQNGVCAICKLPEITMRLAVDHDHKTGEIRGLLCQRCNRFLGQAYEDLNILQNAIKYLQERRAQCR